MTSIVFIGLLGKLQDTQKRLTKLKWLCFLILDQAVIVVVVILHRAWKKCSDSSRGAVFRASDDVSICCPPRSMRTMLNGIYILNICSVLLLIKHWLLLYLDVKDPVCLAVWSAPTAFFCPGRRARPPSPRGH